MDVSAILPFLCVCVCFYLKCERVFASVFSRAIRRNLGHEILVKSSWRAGILQTFVSLCNDSIYFATSPLDWRMKISKSTTVLLRRVSRQPFYLHLAISLILLLLFRECCFLFHNGGNVRTRLAFVLSICFLSWKWPTSEMLLCRLFLFSLDVVFGCRIWFID